MKKLILLILPLLAITVVSCSKDDDNGEKTETVKLVKTLETVYQSGNENEEVTYYYDTDGRVIKSVSTWNTNNITYSADRITEINVDGEKTEFIMNGNGYVTTLAYSWNNETSSQTLTYSNGYLSSIYYNDSPEDQTRFTWQNGNLISFENDYDKVTYTYGTVEDKLNISLDWWLSIGMEYDHRMKGVNSRHYVLTSKSTSGYEETFTYTFDDEGYPTEISVSGEYPKTVKISYY